MRQQGFSIIELMVGATIALLAVLAASSTLALFEGKVRTAVSGNAAHENSLAGLYFIERDIRRAGHGISGVGMPSCPGGINFYYNGKVLANGTPASFGFGLMPVQIIDGGNGSDQINIAYAPGMGSGGKAKIVKDHPATSSILNIDDGSSFQANDVVVVIPPNNTDPCALMGVTKAQKTGQDWNLQHNPSNSFNPSNPNKVFSNAPTYPVGSTVYNLGSIGFYGYKVLTANNTLAASTPAVPADTDIADNIVGLQAQYGLAADATSLSVTEWVNATGAYNVYSSALGSRVLAVRVAILARSGQKEKPNPGTGNCDITSNGTISAWSNGPSFDVSALPDYACYRYQVRSTIVPVRNMIWARN